MKVSDAIKYLETLDPDSHLIVAWWEITAFNGDISQDDWEEFSKYVESKKDWSADHEDITDMYKDWVEGW